jgi:hypothetical protein
VPRQMLPARFGFAGFDGQIVINARTETTALLPTFRRAFTFWRSAWLVAACREAVTLLRRERLPIAIVGESLSDAERLALTPTTVTSSAPRPPYNVAGAGCARAMLAGAPVPVNRARRRGHLA